MAESSQAGTMRSGRTLNHLVPGRDCGDCVACCEVLRIVDPEVGKPAGIMCRHNTGNGCGIPATRPEICRRWFCLWRRIDAIAGRGAAGLLRRDLLPGGRGGPSKSVRALLRGGAARRQFADAAQRAGQAGHRHVRPAGGIAGLGASPWRAQPDPSAADLADAIERPEKTPFQAFVPAAMDWRRRRRAAWPQD
jgi:hypothetical protein